jgi:hypothetical protein
MNQWLWAGTILVALEIPLLGFVLFAPRLDALAGLQAAGSVFALGVIVLCEGFHRTSYTILGVVASFLSFAGTMVFVRFMEHELEP